MKSIVKSRAGIGLEMEDVPVPELGINDVLIKIHKTAICGTDLHIYNWDEWARKTIKIPLVIGHEFAGTVFEVGSNVHGFKKGDVVSGEGHLVCGLCRNCLAGRRHLCAQPSGVGIDRPGAFAEYICIPVANVWYAHPKIPMEMLAYFDPLGNATHTALSFDLIGEDVLITGAGPIGLMATAIAKHVGARHVVVTDINPFRLELAKKMGATLALDAKTADLKKVQNQLGMQEGFDVGMEMSGNIDALRQMIANMVHGGRIALLGILPAKAAIDWTQVIFRSLTIKGIYGREMFETWYKSTSMILSGLDVTPVLTHCFRCEEFEKAFEVMQSGNCGKVILDWA
ncbi:L-threonine 3-dehydrogenase [Candidatus Desantisbacteria bacterium CG07_land_8_20_14_0_80_39_15]|uniref:L-threonine 3-dehydrogenase n=3 Tax=unclassified Candidatus Desantisiibacteriota TaxID=3106372 RepID=A0A2H9PBD4_9BACT|nr:MAG: L-threonine 3-dehydrogenase [Candidatus Desantisbacteria bacterium CG07_land_8_20_14_0_80_39_15]PIZ15201.1 MAG: L-threonine 3-dehydrogenase [Candidatus Desantisbacteria bacterium CG_4_10_14_0_8_um_filter_39_17]